MLCAGQRGTRSLASEIGRTRTLPRPGSQTGHIRFISASCQHFEQGLFVAYEGMIQDDPSFVLHLGDYIYDVSFGPGIRKHEPSAVPETLDDYRLRHALYKQDASLRKAHAELPFVVVPDNHDALEFDDPEAWGRRAAAFQAWYEHLPIRAGIRPMSAAMPIYRTLDVGELVRLYLLDTRQFRDDQMICGDYASQDYGFGIYRSVCEGITNEARSMLGAEQERWLRRRLAGDQSLWNGFATTVPFAPFTFHETTSIEAPAIYYGSWSAYPAARRRLLESIDAESTPNPMFISGDVHSSWVSEILSADGSRVVANELTTTSISSSWPEELSEPIRTNLSKNPQVKAYEPERRGYCLHDIRPDAWTSVFRTMSSVTIRAPEIIDIGPFVFEGAPQ